MERAVDLLALWRNPVFVRFRRSRLRWRKSIFWYLLTLIVATFIVTLTFTIKVNSGATAGSAARDLWIPLLIIQGLILMVKGTGAVSAGLIQDKIDRTLDYQRLTPLPPIRNLIGYLFGLPVLEYAMFALTLPHLAFVVAVGNVPLGTLLSVYLAFFVCVVLYHMTGIAVGIIMKRWVVGYLFSIFMVLTVNVVLPTFVSQFGLKFFQFLSVWPVIGQKVLPLVVSPAALEVAMRNPWYATAGDVPFFDTQFSAFAFTLLMQGALILTFALMALRRWRSESMHSLSKPYALAFLIAFVATLMGNVWPAITGQYMPFAVFGRTDLSEMSETIAIALPVVYSLVTWLLCIVLFSIVVPDHHAWLRGLRRARKRGESGERPWADDSGSPVFMMLFVLAALTGFLLMYREISAAGFLAFVSGGTGSLWRLPLTLCLVLTYTLLLIQVLELKSAALVVLLLWLLPILLSIVLAAITQSAETGHAAIAALSPVATLLMAGATPLRGSIPMGDPAEIEIVSTGNSIGLAFLALQIAALSVRWAQMRSRFAGYADRLATG